MASIRERTLSGGEKAWAVLYRHGNKQRGETFYALSEAEEFRNSIALFGVERALRILRDQTVEDGLTVDDLAAKFLPWKARDVTPRTAADYQRDYDNWVRPHFGHRGANFVTEAEVQKWVDHMATVLSPKSVADKHMLMHSMFKYGAARVRRLVDGNPCSETELPAKKKGRSVKGTTMAEWETVLAEAKRRKADDAHDLVLFMGSVGWRWSEAAALAVRDVYDNGDTVWVDVTRVFRIVANRQVLIEDAAKSQAGFRRVEVLNEEAATMLRRRVTGKGPSDYVFTNRRGTHWNQNTFLRNTWPSIASGIITETRRPTPHWLRHMAVGILRACGLDLEEIRCYIGHENSGTTTKVYGGMMGGLSPDKRLNARAVFAGTRRSGFVVSGELVDPDPQERLLGGMQVLETEPDPVLGELK